MKPDAQDSHLADQLLDSLENLDKILTNIRLGRKEECLEQLARKFQIWPEDSEEQPCDYAGRPQTAARMPTPAKPADPKPVRVRNQSTERQE